MISTPIDTKTKYDSSEYDPIMDNISEIKYIGFQIPVKKLIQQNYLQIHKISNI